MGARLRLWCRGARRGTADAASLWTDDRAEAAAAAHIGDLAGGSRRWVLVATRAVARREYFGKTTQGLFSLNGEGTSVSADCCRAAVAALDRALDDRPDMIYHD